MPRSVIAAVGNVFRGGRVDSSSQGYEVGRVGEVGGAVGSGVDIGVASESF